MVFFSSFSISVVCWFYNLLQIFSFVAQLTKIARLSLRTNNLRQTLANTTFCFLCGATGRQVYTTSSKAEWGCPRHGGDHTEEVVCFTLSLILSVRRLDKIQGPIRDTQTDYVQIHTKVIHCLLPNVAAVSTDFFVARTGPCRTCATDILWNLPLPRTCSQLLLTHLTTGDRPCALEQRPTVVAHPDIPHTTDDIWHATPGATTEQPGALTMGHRLHHKDRAQSIINRLAICILTIKNGTLEMGTWAAALPHYQSQLNTRSLR